MMLNANEVGKRYGVAANTVNRWRKQGRIPAPVVIGGTVRWQEVDLIEWEAAGCPASFKTEAGEARK